MRSISLQALPNQAFTFSYGGNTWRIRLISAFNRMLVDVYLNDEALILGSPIITNCRIIPYPSMDRDGNFIIDAMPDEDVNWRNFGVSQILYYITPDELP